MNDPTDQNVDAAYDAKCDHDAMVESRIDHGFLEGLTDICVSTIDREIAAGIAADDSPMTVADLHTRFVQLIDEYARRNLTNPSHPRTIEQRPETLGLMIAGAFGWDANVIYRVAGEALEDSNFHDEAAILRAHIPEEDIEGYEEGTGLKDSQF